MLLRTSVRWRRREGRTSKIRYVLDRAKQLLSLTNNHEESAIILSTCDKSSFMLRVTSGGFHLVRTQNYRDF